MYETDLTLEEIFFSLWFEFTGDIAPNAKIYHTDSN